MRLRFDERRSHVLHEGGLEIRGGEEFDVDDDRALELLTHPHMRISQIAEPAGDEGDRNGAVPLQRLNRRELNEFARERGVREPEKLNSKGAVITAIDEMTEPGASAGGGHQVNDPEEGLDV